MSRAAYQQPPAQTDGRLRSDDLKALLALAASWPFPSLDVTAPLSGRYRVRRTLTAE